MNPGLQKLPENWLDCLGGRDASGWLSTFVERPNEAVADLLWDRFYFGPLNPVEPGQLLSGWLERLGNRDQFAERLDEALVAWIVENWVQFDRPAAARVAAWNCLANVVEFSANLAPNSRLNRAAKALHDRFTDRQQCLGGISTAPVADPLGRYLAAIASFQGQDRSLAGFWHQLCDLPDGTPFYHAPYGMLGLRHLPAADPAEDGTLKAEVVLGILRVAKALDRRVRTRGLPEDAAKSTFHRLATQTAAAYPGSSRWVAHGLEAALELPERPRQWVIEGIQPLAMAVRQELARVGAQYPRPARSILPDATWPERARRVSSAIRRGQIVCLPEAEHLLEEQRWYARLTGEVYFIVRSLCNLATCLLRFQPATAARWAEEARKWQPSNAFAWTTLAYALLRQGKVARALATFWIAWKRFPEDVVVRNGLAEVLKADKRYAEAEEAYRETVELFPRDVVARTGLAEVLKGGRRYAEAEVVYREAVRLFPENVVARNGLADTLRRGERVDEAEQTYRETIKLDLADSATFTALAFLILRRGEVGRQEALELCARASASDPLDPYLRTLNQRLRLASEKELSAFAAEWDEFCASHSSEPSMVQDLEETIYENGTEELALEAAWGAFASERPNLPSAASPGEAQNEALPVSKPFAGADPIEVAALVAEAQFYRAWAGKGTVETAMERRRTAADLIAKAERLSPQDTQVLAEKLALMGGSAADTMGNLTIQLEHHPGAAPLLVLKARLDRDAARKTNRALDDTALVELSRAPDQLRHLDPAFIPMFHFQKGLAVLALVDGAKRSDIAAEAFSGFRRTLSRRAEGEKMERETATDRRPNQPPDSMNGSKR